VSRGRAGCGGGETGALLKKINVISEFC